MLSAGSFPCKHFKVELLPLAKLHNGNWILFVSNLIHEFDRNHILLGFHLIVSWRINQFNLITSHLNDFIALIIRNQFKRYSTFIAISDFAVALVQKVELINICAYEWNQSTSMRQVLVV